MVLARLDANQPPERFYRGGVKIDRFRGTAKGPDFRPEDWIGSTTTVAGEKRLGLSRLRDGRLLADAIAADPLGWLGAEHVAAFGSSTMLLVKLLDAGQRLPVHAHPDDAFARAHLHSATGKAEAWFILEGGTVYLGLHRDLDRQRLADLVQWQDTTALLSLLHEREVEPGEVVWVPPGELHAIGKGVFLLELQQPADLSIVLEWSGFALDGTRDGHLGLGFDQALEAVTRHGRSTDEVDAWVVSAADEGDSILPIESEPYFRLARHVVDGEATIAPGFAIILVEEGGVEGGGLKIRTAAGGSRRAVRGRTFALAHGEGALSVTGFGTILVCRPPLPPESPITPRG